METKSCSQCGSVKPLEDYYREKLGIGGRRSACKSCERVRYAGVQKKWRDKNKKSRSAKELQRYYMKKLEAINNKLNGGN